MTLISHVRATALATAVIALALPSAALAASSDPGSGTTSGGAGLNSTTTTTPPTTTTPAASATPGQLSAPVAATPVGGPVSAQGDGFTLSTSSVGTFRQTLGFAGSVASSSSGDVVAIQRQSAVGEWQTIAQATVASDGSFAATWRPSNSGLVSFRATLQGPAGTAQAASASPASASPSVAVTIYRNAIATIYGPGFYGHKTACGSTLTAATIGVASRTLKCGTKVSIDYNGQSITVPVIDRGPYANGASWDLTEATARALGDPDTETVGAAVL